MVKIVFRKEKDVVRAYFKGLGFVEEFDAEEFMQTHAVLSMEGCDIQAELEKIVYAAAVKLLPRSLSVSQAVALYKAAYLELEGAKRWRTAPFEEGFDNQEYQNEMRRHLVMAVPGCAYSEMPTQVIEAYSVKGKIKKLWRKKA